MSLFLGLEAAPRPASVHLYQEPALLHYYNFSFLKPTNSSGPQGVQDLSGTVKQTGLPESGCSVLGSDEEAAGRPVSVSHRSLDPDRSLRQAEPHRLTTHRAPQPRRTRRTRIQRVDGPAAVPEPQQVSELHVHRWTDRKWTRGQVEAEPV